MLLGMDDGARDWSKTVGSAVGSAVGAKVSPGSVGTAETGELVSSSFAIGDAVEAEKSRPSSSARTVRLQPEALPQTRVVKCDVR